MIKEAGLVLVGMLIVSTVSWLVQQWIGTAPAVGLGVAGGVLVGGVAGLRP